MKCINKYILFFVFLVPVLTRAQDKPAIFANYKEGGGVATAKRVTGPDANDDYTLTLETFATGEKSILKKAIPSDIILLLDYSSSMLSNDNITKLKTAVVTFVKQMQENNEEIASSLRPGQAGNRIAFVLYAGLLYDDYPNTTQRMPSGNGLLNDYPYFNAKYVNDFIEVDEMTAAGTSVMYNNVNIISPSSQHNPHPDYLGSSNFGDTNKGTNTPAAMAKALELVNANLTAYSSNERSTTVVLFTDGEPCDIYQSYYQPNINGQPAGQSGFSAAYANDCLADAKTIKSKGVNIFSVGLFNYNGNNSTANRQTRTFVEYTSSNYPDVAPTQTDYWTNTANLLNINDPMSGDYCKIVSSGLDLSGVFKTIAEASGGSAATIPTQTEVRDIVNTSYTIPEGFSPSSVTVYWQNPTTDGTDWNTTKHPLTVVTATKNDVLTGQNAVSYITDESKVGVLVDGSKLTILGFDYSKADTGDATAADFNPDGNWVGWRQVNRDVNNDGTVNEKDKICAGKKLVISFKIKAAPGATGGDGTNTNTSDSGVYVPSFDSNGNITGYTNVNSYPVPHADIPINIVIEKRGLKHGESATIQIYWAPQSTEYNKETGKLKPDLDTEWDGANATNHKGWGNFSKLILTNQGDDNTVVTETLLCLDPKYVYLLAEDDWGWAYDLDTESVDTSEQEFNPFVFTNTPKTNVVKHAEAASFNYFKGPDYTPAKKTITVKSKAKLSTPANGGN